MKTKVHLMAVLVVDHDGLGADDVKYMLECTRYANRCVSPSVLETQTQEVVWEDDHPLNSTQHMAQAVADLFPSVTHAAIAEAEERGRREATERAALLAEEQAAAAEQEACPAEAEFLLQLASDIRGVSR